MENWKNDREYWLLLVRLEIQIEKQAEREMVTRVAQGYLACMVSC